MNIRNIFHWTKKEEEPKPLAISNVGDAPITAEADDAELAAQALLEIIIDKQAHRRHRKRKRKSDGQRQEVRDAAYYHRLADRIRQAYDISRQRTLRFVSYCEQQLRNPDIPVHGDNSLQLIETELYKRIDIIDREGGELKTRWQHCIADVTVRLMDAQRKGEAQQQPADDIKK